jgi:small subunit ribosomal protein S5
MTDDKKRCDDIGEEEKVSVEGSKGGKTDGEAGGRRKNSEGNSQRGGRTRGKNKGRRKGRQRAKEHEEKEFEEELLQVDRVTRVVKGGRRLRFRATVVVGDRKGRVGFGVDKAVEVPQAIQKAVRVAKKNLIRVPMVGGTIPHDVCQKFKSAKILIMPADSGRGIIAGGAMRKIADLAGIEDMIGKNIGTSNKISSGKAMILALSALRKVSENGKRSIGDERT